jgi:hypothetical protein
MTCLHNSPYFQAFHRSQSVSRCIEASRLPDSGATEDGDGNGRHSNCCATRREVYGVFIRLCLFNNIITSINYIPNDQPMQPSLWLQKHSCHRAWKAEKSHSDLQTHTSYVMTSLRCIFLEVIFPYLDHISIGFMNISRPQGPGVSHA